MDLRFTKIGLNFKQNSGPQHCKSRVCRIFMILKSCILKISNAVCEFWFENKNIFTVNI